MKAEDGSYYEVPVGTEGAVRFMDQWWTMTYEPQLFEMPETVGELKKGTVICGGVTKSDNNAAIVVYKSTDGLKSWQYHSRVALGGKEQTGVGSAIWEPFFICEKGVLYCFFSDERGMADGGGQKLVYSKCADGKSWSEVVDVCNFSKENKSFRPGMPTVAKLSDGRFLLVYEGVNMNSKYLPTYYKITDNIEEWRSEEKGEIMPFPMDGGSPYTVVMPNGNIVVGSHSTGSVAVNCDNLKTNTWTIVPTNMPNAYSRSLFPTMDGKLLIVSGGAFSGEDPRVLTASVCDITIDNEITPVSVTGSIPWGEAVPNYDNAAEKAADGDPKTFFDGLQDGYVILDLGREYNVSAIGYTARYDFGFRVKGSEFYASKDGESWTKLYTVTNTPSNSVINYAKVENGEYRYIKYNTNGEEFCSIAEIKVYTDEIPVTVEREENTVKIKAEAGTRCIAAVYDNDGILIKVLIFKDDTETEYTENMAYVKVFCWDEFNVMRPFVLPLK